MYSKNYATFRVIENCVSCLNVGATVLSPCSVVLCLNIEHAKGFLSVLCHLSCNNTMD